MRHRQAEALRQRIPQWLICAFCLFGAGCSTLTPQVFSGQLLTRYPDADPRPSAPVPDASSSRSVADAIAEAERTQRLYVQAVKDLSDVSAGSSAALIGLSALAIFKGITSPNSSDLAGLGVLGSATFAYGSLMVSKPRQALYLAGAEALNCAVAATRPYALDPAVLDNASSAGPPGLQQLMNDAGNASAALRNQVVGLGSFNVAREEWVAVGRPAEKACAGQVAENCERLKNAANDATNQFEACQVRERERIRRCAGPTQVLKQRTIHPAVPAMLTTLNRQIAHIDGLLATAEQQRAEFDGAGNRLWERTVAIQLKVAAEVLKTEPEMSAVLAGAQAMRGTAFSLSNAPALKPAADDLPKTAGQSSNQGVRQDERQERPWQALDAAQSALDESDAPARALRQRLAYLQNRVKQSRRQIDQCSIPGASVVSLNVVPSDDAITLSPGAERVFSVSPPAGVLPTHRIEAAAGVKAGKLTRSINEQNQFEFRYQADPEAADGSVVVLRFLGDAKTLPHEVTLTIRKDGKS